MCPGYGASPSSAMAYANFQTPPYHYRQPPWAPAPDFSQLMMQPPQRNNTPEPTTTNNNQQLPVHSLQVPPQIPFTSHPGPATLQTGQHLQASSVSHPVPYLNGPPTQQSTSQFPPLNRQPQQEAGPSTHSGQPMVQTLQYAPNHRVLLSTSSLSRKCTLRLNPDKSWLRLPSMCRQTIRCRSLWRHTATRSPTTATHPPANLHARLAGPVDIKVLRDRLGCTGMAEEGALDATANNGGGRDER
jgi:hypothetical protein